ncbi:MAG TPA: hypothetical protein VHQ43_08285 [Solirubrobacterales bacterium]|jgi:hypothetical protein|nr:hypothetical protein [Solirubrobacterales bacterium]
MLHIATVHFRAPRWIPVQQRELRRHIEADHQVWATLVGIDPSYGRYFDRLVDHGGDRPKDVPCGIDHAGRLNLLAAEICREAEDDDLLMFLDSDAFPIADPAPLIAEGLATAPLLAIKRPENCDDPHPHPCFCVTTVRTWRSLPGDWSEGHQWVGPRDEPITDVGANLLHRLEQTGTPWTPVLRSNRRNPHPLMFGVYGDAIYHHGAGSRFPLARVDVAHMDTNLPQNRDELFAIMERNRRSSDAFFQRIERDDPGWLAELAR